MHTAGRIEVWLTDSAAACTDASLTEVAAAADDTPGADPAFMEAPDQMTRPGFTFEAAAFSHVDQWTQVSFLGDAKSFLGDA